MAEDRFDQVARDRRSRLRGRALSSLVVAGALVLATLLVPAPDPAVAAEQVTDGHDHDHDDAATKNAVSREAATAETADPTTPVQAAVGNAAVARQRREPDPRLVPLAKAPGRRAVPQDRYAMASGCYALRSTRTGRWVRRAGDGFAAFAGSRSGGTPLHFRATDLGRYLLYGDRSDFVAQDENPLTSRVVSADAPSSRADLVVRRRGSSYTFQVLGTQDYLTTGPGGAITTSATPGTFGLHTTTGCARWPEVETNIGGRTFRGVSKIQEVRGLVDAHTHGMAFEFLGGDVHCGRPWHPYGVTFALKDCPDHYVADGRGAALEDLLNSGTPGTGHDPVGWPTFKDWPAPHSLTHEGTYYKWMERSWRGGLRVFTNLLVENGKLCQLYPLKHNSCDDMDSIRLQAKDMRLFERYIDAQYGGPGKGWYRIVRDPYQARRVINDGKLAVIMGIETSRAVRLHPEGRRARPHVHPGDHRPAARRGPRARRLADGAGQQVRQRAVGRGR